MLHNYARYCSVWSVISDLEIYLKMKKMFFMRFKA